MLPERSHPRTQGRRNIPTKVVIAGAVALLLAGLFIWVTLGIGQTPQQESVTVDLPVRS